MKFATGVGLAVMMAVIIISQRGLPLGFGWLDAVALGLFFLLLGHANLLWTSQSGLLDDDAVSVVEFDDNSLEALATFASHCK